MAFTPNIENNKREYYFFEDVNTIAFNKNKKQKAENEIEEPTENESQPT